MPNAYALRFISGKYQGGEFPLPTSGEIVIGRSSELDMVLVEDMVSRRHAKITAKGDELFLQDLGSTNGSFVNGEKVERARLEEGDRVLIGTSIIKVITIEPSSSGVSAQQLQQAKAQFQDMAAAQPPSTARKTMTGSIAEVPLADLLQLFSTSKKTGTLVVQNGAETGRIYLDKGHVVHCVIDERPQLAPEQAFYRLFSWQEGTFDMEPSSGHNIANPMTMSTQALLMEAVRLMDEVGRMGSDMPSLDATVDIAVPLEPKLSALGKEELDALQVCLNSATVGDVLTNADSIGETMIKLINKGYLVVH